MPASWKGFVWRQSMPVDDAKPSILDMPLEIRYMIFEMIFGPPQRVRNIRPRYLVIPGTSLRQLDMGPKDAQRIDMAIMLTCKQFHYETSEFFYSRNTFLVADSAPVMVQKHGGTLLSQPALCRQYSAFVREATSDIFTKGLTWVRCLECVKMLGLWPNIAILNLKVSPALLNEYKSTIDDCGSFEAAVSRSSQVLKSVCSIQNFRVPKGLEVRLVVDADFRTERAGPYVHWTTRTRETVEKEVLQQLQAVATEVVKMAQGARIRVSNREKS